ncbi:hypothetical protein QFC22_000939 [Naganishia vaughanmartiniae]|uniref:Uncharacterized protein n=1 Tax=Naganishia vaughanmartiniae TaxID=1424756 RepID=A0ACC2XKI7_9TREE|nr:hypothetical protein QFC22_000939 [Naganishia vaughanmartiniae]
MITKTDAQRRYLKKKLDKRKKVLKAKKASEPKQKDGETPEPSASRIDAAVKKPVTIEKPSADDHTTIPAAGANDGIAATEGDEESEESLEVRRAKRKAEKKLKREERRALEKEMEEQRVAMPISATGASTGPSNTEQKRSREDIAETAASPKRQRQASAVDDQSDEEAEVERSGTPLSAHSRTPSPETENRRIDQDLELEMEMAKNLAGIPTFPLPSGPAKASAGLLSMQGLPPALRDAERVAQELRVTVKDIQIRQHRRRHIAQEDEQANTDSLSSRMRKQLEDSGIEEFFAVQTALVPELAGLPLVTHADEFLHDYLVSAPTGSGKTLSYAVPLIEVLSKRIVTRLRALIILPTRDLVMQVRETLESLSRGTGLRIGTATGQHSFAQEQSTLVADLESAIFVSWQVCGKIIDEADRLLNQSFQDWLAQVLTHLAPESQASEASQGIVGHDAVASSWYEGLGLQEKLWEGSRPLSSQCQKLLFSATLTRDPSKIAALQLRNPRYFIVGDAAPEPVEGSQGVPADITGNAFALPSTLTERMIILPSEFKPLNLLYLLHDPRFGIRSALCFTKSVDSAERLLKLIQFFEDAYPASSRKLIVKGYSGELPTAERTKLLSDFKRGEVDLLICSDLIARGIDLPSVTHVISYDAPVDMRKYVHRVGRTARAGREGTAWTLVEKQEARHFKEMLSAANHLSKVKKIKIKEEQLTDLRESYNIALSRLKSVYAKA